ncbi:MAG: DNA polymerase III subunit alpha [Paludibacteraceae bacterium]|nr:DNA polymerase III subunit alpha [Paludibacteraceae bacterium]
MNSFVHLHVHSHYSILDGMSSIPDLIEKAIAHNMPALALTDHGNMFGIKEFYNYVKKKNQLILDKITSLTQQFQNIQLTDEEKKEIQLQIDQEKKNLFKPIIGCETYVAHRSRHLKETPEDRSGYHLILLAKNKTGYHNLCKIITLAYTEGMYYRPRIDKELLEKYREGLIATSACLGGEIHKKIESGNLAEAEEAILWYKKIFGDDFYLELQRHQTEKPGADVTTYEKQKIQNAELIKLARKTNTKLIATNDVHFVEEEHADAHERLICLSTGTDLDDPQRMRYTKQEWLKTPQEMAAIFEDIPEALNNTLEVAEKVEFYDIDSAPVMPLFPIPEDFATEAEYRSKFTEEMLRQEFEESFDRLGGYNKVVRIKLEADYLTKLTLAGAEERYGKNLPPEIEDRINYELKVIKTMGFPGYFLIVQDFIQAARDMGVAVGPGRGSAAGSVVAYCLKITDIDPLKYDLLFERFLNPDRISMPDIDIDFDDDGRNQVLHWVTEKYGKNRVAHIITFGTMAAKMAIKDVARVQKLPLSEAERLTKLIPDRLPDTPDGKKLKVNLSNCFEFVPEIQVELDSSNKNIVETLKYAEMLEGTVRQTGVHACGVIIGADDLSNFIPLSTAEDKDTKEEILVTQYEGSVIEEVGLIKMDFLGLKTLSIIKDTIENIKKSKGIEIDISSIPIDDPETYQLFSKGQTIGTFQFESPGMQKYLQALQPTQFEDLIAMNALYRPGPMQYIPQFIKRKHGLEKIEYPFPVMEKRLKETYGITIYQEQVMLLSVDLAGFTRSEADELRKAMGKKLNNKMEALKEKFIIGCQKNGYGPLEKIEQIWNDWIEFSNYAFNKSHATCYSLIAYQTAYLKAHYPAEFMAANLSRNKDNIDEIRKFMDECKNMGINVLGPDINESDLTFSVNEKGDIRFGLGGIKGVGEGAVTNIINERNSHGKFKSIFDFVERVNLSACNKRTFESLALAGAFDSLNDIQREQFFVENSKGEQVLESLIKYGNKFQIDKSMNHNTLFGLFDEIEIAKPEIPFAPQWSSLVRLNKEKELIGIYLSAHPLDEYEFEINYLCNTTTSDLKNLNELTGKTLKLAGIVTSIRHATSRTGKPYGVFTLEDYNGSYEFVLYGNNYIDFQKYMIKDLYLFIQATVQEKYADSNYRKKSNFTSSELELKIQKIDLLQDIKNKIINSLTLMIPLQELTNDLAQQLTDVVLQNKGNINLYIQVFDDQNVANKINFFARRHKIEMNSTVFQFLKEIKKNGKFDFQVN